MGSNILNGNIGDLKEIREMLKSEQDKKNILKQLYSKQQSLRKDIEQEEKILKEKIDSTIKNRRGDVSSSFNKEISKKQYRIKSIRKDRKNACKKAIKQKIARETVEYVQENKNLKEEIRTTFKQKGVMKFFDNTVFYSLTYPLRFREIVIAFLYAICSVFIAPILFINYTNAEGILKFIAYIFILTIFVLIYGFIYSYARVRYHEVFESVKIQRLSIYKNQRKIQRIKTKIKKDKENEEYNLSVFDQEIDKLSKEIDEIIIEKNKALNSFEKKTKNEISEEIQKREVQKIEELRKTLILISEKIITEEDFLKSINLKVSNEYAPYFGVDNLTLEKVEKMILLMETTDVASIGEVILEIKNK